MIIIPEDKSIMEPNHESMVAGGNCGGGACTCSNCNCNCGKCFSGKEVIDVYNK